MKFSHEQRSDSIQRILLSMAAGQSVALVFGELFNDPRRRGSQAHFNVRLSDTDQTGLHIISPAILAEDLHGGDSVMLVCELHPRQARTAGPNPRFHVIYLAVSDDPNT